MPSPDENFPHKNDRTFHQRCLSRARDEPVVWKQISEIFYSELKFVCVESTNFQHLIKSISQILRELYTEIPPRPRRADLDMNLWLLDSTEIRVFTYHTYQQPCQLSIALFNYAKTSPYCKNTYQMKVNDQYNYSWSHHEETTISETNKPQTNYSIGLCAIL